LDREAENDLFARHVKEMDPLVIDQMVHQLNEDISPRIDCTVCGNCCKTLMINVEEVEADRLTNHLAITRTDFDQQYLEKGSNGMMVMNAIPCSFLTEKKCTVYEYRFDGCREFPAMHLPGFSKRLFTTLMHYGRCPIIFNIVEAMKEQMSDVRSQMADGRFDV
jgi:uncharacterized protein